MTEWYIPKDNDHTVNLVWPSVSMSLRGTTEAQSTVILKALVLFSSTAILSWWQSDQLCYRKGGIVTKTLPGFFSLNVHLTVVSGCLEIKFCQQKNPTKVSCSHAVKWESLTRAAQKVYPLTAAELCLGSYCQEPWRDLGWLDLCFS